MSDKLVIPDDLRELHEAALRGKKQEEGYDRYDNRPHYAMGDLSVDFLQVLANYGCEGPASENAEITSTTPYEVYISLIERAARAEVEVRFLKSAPCPYEAENAARLGGKEQG